MMKISTFTVLLYSGIFTVACSTLEKEDKQTEHAQVETVTTEKTIVKNIEPETIGRDRLAVNVNKTIKPSISAQTTAIPINKIEESYSALPSKQRITNVIPKIDGKAKLRKEESHMLNSMTAFPSPMLIAPGSQLNPVQMPQNRENYQHIDNNSVKYVKNNPITTFSIDVDTASFTNVRRIINQGTLPPSDAVRVEEFVNYFSYDYPAPSKNETPFSISTEVGPSPWSKDRYLLHIGLQGYEVPEVERPPVNLVFLIDVSGSMNSSNKLPLLKKSLSFLVNKMRPEDHVSMVVYAGASGLVLSPTSGKEKATILSALDQLHAGGSTNGAAGIQLAYQTALQKYKATSSNLILLATDGDFNVGTTNFHQLIDLIKEKRKSGIAISTLGFGAGNYNDHLAEQIADAGNGSASYIDSLQEARKVLVDHVGSALIPIARDTKTQIEFNPNRVSEYRLIGYENRKLENHEFNMDSVDAGDLFSGHSVTAIYEIALVGHSKPSVDPLRYSTDNRKQDDLGQELAFLKIRYKANGHSESTMITQPISSKSIKTEFDKTSEDFRFSASVAAYGQLLRGSPYVQDLNMTDVIRLAKQSKGADTQGYRSAFINQVSLTSVLKGEPMKISTSQ